MVKFKVIPCPPSLLQSAALGPAPRCAGAARSHLEPGIPWLRRRRQGLGGFAGACVSVELLGAVLTPSRGVEMSGYPRWSAEAQAAACQGGRTPGVFSQIEIKRRGAARSGAGLARAGGACVRGQERRGWGGQAGRQALKTSASQN